MPADFDPAALLDKPVDDVKPPVQLPLGSYVATTSKYEFTEARNEDKTKLVRYTVILQEPLPDVDADALAAALDGEQLSSKEQRLEFWLTPAALYRLKEFGEDHCKAEGSTMRELIEDSLGKQFVAVMGSQPNKKNPERPYIQIVSTAAMPEA